MINFAYEKDYCNLKKGQIFVHTDGVYSDFQVMAVYQAKKPFNMNTELERWQLEEERFQEGRPDRYRSIKNNTLKFMPWLLSNGLIEEVNVCEFHDGDYGFNPSFFCRD